MKKIPLQLLQNGVKLLEQSGYHMEWHLLYVSIEKGLVGTWVPLYNSELWVLTLLQTILQSNGEEDDEDTTID